MRKIISLICFLLPVLAYAEQPETSPQIRSDAPDQHVVVKGDTLWGISGKFFKDPWRWPYIWGMNKDSIKDPHWIYPGAVIVLDRATGTLRIGGEASQISINNDTVKLSPSVRESDSDQNAIPTIPFKDIEPFLSQPLTVDDATLASAPRIIGHHEDRIVIAPGDVVYVKGINEDQGNKWQIYRPGKTFVDPDTREVLGHEAIYLGSAEVKKFDDISTIIINDTHQEILPGDRLIVPGAIPSRNFLPRTPDSAIRARIISIYGDALQAGQNTVVVLNKGHRDGLQSGHVLALSHKGRIARDGKTGVALPDEHYGLLVVFRTFDKVAYALVMQTRVPVDLLDDAVTP